MTQFDAVLATVGILVLLTSLVSRLIEKSVLSRPLLALVLGVLLGPAVLGVLDPAAWGHPEEVVLKEAARVTLSIGLMGVALRLPKRYFPENKGPIAIVLIVLMPLMWLASGLLVHLLLGLPLWASLLVGAIVTPTDPIVATAVVSGGVAEKNLPGRLRHLLSAESGANDGLALPLVMAGVLALTAPPADAAREWLVKVVLQETLLGVVLGAAIGYAAGRALDYAQKHHDMRAPSILAYTLALSLLTLGAVKLAGSNGILAVFVAGIAFDLATTRDEQREDENVQESVNLFFTLPSFALLGLVLPWHEWLALGWRGAALVLLILLLRRLPAVVLLSRAVRPVRGAPDALWLGWFGPVGVAALYYAVLVREHVELPEAWAVATLVIAASVLAHGVTATPFSRAYGRRTDRGRDEGG